MVDPLVDGIIISCDTIFARLPTLHIGVDLFRQAAELDPKKEAFWSNLGVTQMRLNLLDEALISYTRGLRVNPGSSLIKSNMKALQEHLSFREKAGPSTEDVYSDYDDISTDDDYLDTYDDDGESESNAVQEEASAASNLFGPWWKNRDALDRQIREALVNFRPVTIRNVLNKEFALALHKELYDSSEYEVYEAYHRWYQFHFQAIYQHNPSYSSHKKLNHISSVFDSPEVKDWVKYVSNSEVNGTTMAGASYYAAGDYTMPHTDRAGGGNGEKQKRRVAYILHLTKAWNPKFGGDMVWMNPAYHIHPCFNAMTLFAVSESSWHFVSPVAGITPDSIKRLAFSGWWTTTNIKQANSIEAQKNDQLRFTTFATVIDGNSGRSIPHLEAYEKMDGLWPRLVS